MPLVKFKGADIISNNSAMQLKNALASMLDNCFNKLISDTLSSFFFFYTQPKSFSFMSELFWRRHSASALRNNIMGPLVSNALFYKIRKTNLITYAKILLIYA